jgi:uncharacterized protein YdbL (DUF1318 family)
MKTTLLRTVALFTLVSMTVGASALRAEDLGAVKHRMEQRLAQIDHLKSQGVIGETNRGLLELRGGNVEAGDAVAAENRDREIVYAEIAKQTGTSFEQVARHRARKIAADSARGVWLQKEDGSWYRK